MSDKVNIDWSYSGKTDGLAGTGATNAERILAYGFAIFITLSLILFLRLNENPATYGWRLWLLIFLVFDVLGGVVANMLNSCKRHYHSPPKASERGFARLVKSPIAFAALHIHPIIVAWAFWETPCLGLGWYLALLIGVVLTLKTPLYLRRPMATAIVVMASLMSFYVFGYGSGLEWFIPALFFKIVLAHSVREEPYRPVRGLAA